MSDRINNSESRRYARIPIDGDVTLRCGEGEYQSQIHDISLKGAMITRPAEWPITKGSQCELIFALDTEGDVIRMQGHVAHETETLIGIHCDAIDIDSIAHLKRLVELNLGDEAELERELHELAAGE